PQPPFRPAAPQPRPPADPRLLQRAWASVALAVLGLVAMVLIGNIQRGAVVAVVALVVALVALVLAFSTLSAAKRARARRPGGAVAGAVLGIIAAGFSGFVLLGFMIFGTQLDQFANCINGANTVAEQRACQDQLVNSINAKLGIAKH